MNATKHGRFFVQPERRPGDRLANLDANPNLTVIGAERSAGDAEPVGLRLSLGQQAQFGVGTSRRDVRGQTTSRASGHLVITC